MKVILEYVLEDESLKGKILILKQTKFILRFCSSRKSLLDHNLGSSFTATYLTKMVLEVWRLDSSVKVLAVEITVLHIA